MTAQRNDGVSARWVSLRRRVGWLDHGTRMCTRYLTHRGYQQAAAITYFSVLSLVPVLMVVLSVAGYLLAGQPWVLGRLHHASQQAVPVALQPVVADGVDSAIDHRFGLGLAGILFAAYSGWNWINALRDALTGMWRLRRIDAPVITTIAEDCLALLGLGLALVVTFAVSAVGSGLGRRLLGLAGVDGTWLASTALSAGSVFVGVAASWLVFWWVLAELPRVAVSRRAARAPALIVAMAFEVLKQLVNLYLQALGRSPIGVTLGSVVGVLVFAYLVSRLLLLAAAWIATAPSPRRLAESRRGDPRRATVPTPRRSPEAVTVDRSAFMIYRSADPGDPRRAD